MRSYSYLFYNYINFNSFIATSILFVYLVHVTMFAACIAVSGYCENDNRHGLTCWKISPASNASKLKTSNFLIFHRHFSFKYKTFDILNFKEITVFFTNYSALVEVVKICQERKLLNVI